MVRACERLGGQNHSEADSVLGYEQYHRDRITVIRDSIRSVLKETKSGYRRRGAQCLRQKPFSNPDLRSAGGLEKVVRKASHSSLHTQPREGVSRCLAW
jgi:hypothetical protein